MKFLAFCFTVILIASMSLKMNASAETETDAQPTTADASYEALAAAYFNELFHENPSTASDAGIHDYDSALDDLSPAHFVSELTTDKALLAKLDAINPKNLSPEIQIDRQMLIYALKDDLLNAGTRADWRHNPDMYTGTASGAIFGIVMRNYAPLAKRMHYAIARERQIPRLLSQAKMNLTTVDAATAEVSYEDAAGAVSFFENDVTLAFAPIKDAALQKQFRVANAAAAKAVADYAGWIKAGPLAHPSGTFALGRAQYAQRLLYIDAVTMPVEQYLSIGERALAGTQKQFVSVAHHIDPKRSPIAVYETLSLKHPPANGVLAAAQKDVTALRAFVSSHHIISLPPDADIHVIETPSFARSQVFAAFDPPGPLEKVATQTYYFVTPPDQKWPKARQNMMLGFLNDFGRPIISAHEIMPGHFVNWAIDRHLNLSLTRKLMFNPEFGEGWAHYDEQMIVDEGWGNGDPRVRLAQLHGALMRECRYVVGVKLHTQGMTVDQATAFLMKNAYMTQDDARREALRGTQDPMYGYYTLGKLMILKLRSDYQKKMGSQYSLQGFHDALLAHGDPPIPLLRPLLLGSDDDGKPI
jgi:Bacterial protein of unknown function (DUF885)